MKINMGEFLEAQRTDALCQELAYHQGRKESHFRLDHHDFIVGRSSLYRALQKVVPERLRKRLLYLVNFPRLAGHPRSTRMYYTLRWSYYWPHTANDVYHTVKECDPYLCIRGTLQKTKGI